MTTRFPYDNICTKKQKERVMNLEKIVLELMTRIQNLEERVDNLEKSINSCNEKSDDFPEGEIGSKYKPLAEYLFEKNEKRVSLTYREIESILGCKLPKTAYSYPPSFWANTETHSYSSAWMKIGYKARIKIAEKTVIFEKKS